MSIEKDHENNEFVEKTFQSAPSAICLHLFTSYRENNDDDDQLK